MVAGLAKAGGEEFLGEREAELLDVADGGIELVSEALLVATGEIARARRRADGGGEVGGGEGGTFAGESIDVGSGEFLAAGETDIADAEVVGDDDENVGLGGKERGARSGERGVGGGRRGGGE